MATATKARILVDGREYPMLPRGVQIWHAFGSVTGVGSGTMDVDFQINPDTRPDWQPYVALCHVAIGSSVALLTNQVAVLLNSGQWERSAATSYRLRSIVMNLSFTAVHEEGADTEMQYLGRALASQLAEIRVGTLDVNTTVMGVNASGLISDKPFVPYDFWRV